MHNRKMNLVLITGCIITFIALIAVIIAGTCKNIKENKISSAYSARKSEDNAAKATPTPTPTPEIQKIISNPYEKIQNKKDISVLIIGDNIAASEGMDENSKWYNVFASSLNNSYGTNVNFKIAASSKQGISQCLDYYNKNEVSNKYDFVFVCLGEYDINILKLDQFQSNYESLLRSIKTSNQNCEIIPIIESSIQIDKNYPLAITNLSNYYGLPLMDAREAFAKSNTPYKNLTSGVNLPNAQGCKLYASAMFDLIKANVDKPKEVKAFDKAAMYTK